MSTVQQQQLQSFVSVYAGYVQAKYYCVGHLLFDSIHSLTRNHCSYVHNTKDTLDHVQLN